MPITFAIYFVKEFNGMDRRTPVRGQDPMPDERNSKWQK
jgi:hypothetical protein